MILTMNDNFVDGDELMIILRMNDDDINNE